MKRILKVKHTAGVHYKGNEFEDIGKSKIDGFPMYSFDDKEINLKCLKYYYPNFVFNTRPGYTPTESDFELRNAEELWVPVKSITERYSGKNILGTDDIIPVQPLNGPIGKLFYFDYVYENQLDNRLLLML